jgi:hypothetical protein
LAYDLYGEKETHHGENETYYGEKETYHGEKETYYKAKAALNTSIPPRLLASWSLM